MISYISSTVMSASSNIGLPPSFSENLSDKVFSNLALPWRVAKYSMFHTLGSRLSPSPLRSSGLFKSAVSSLAYLYIPSIKSRNCSAAFFTAGSENFTSLPARKSTSSPLGTLVKTPNLSVASANILDSLE